MELKLDIATTRNLLAYSGGVDSTALFYILLQNNIEFDIAIVDYGLRDSSKDELLYAKQLAKKFSKKIYVEKFPINTKFSQKIGREFRYNFFKSICEKFHYSSVITAHHLNDRLEWFMMQLSKGAGINELLSMQKSYRVDNLFYLKPLLDTSKEKLKKFVENKKIKYFEDISNHDTKYKRNFIRKNFVDEFLALYKDGVQKSFDFLDKELSIFNDFPVSITRHKKLCIMNYTDIKPLQTVWLIDKELKSRGLMISSKTKEYILTQKELVVSHKYVVAYNDSTLCIAPYIKAVIPKKTKDIYRKKRYPKLLRPYLFVLGFGS